VRRTSSTPTGVFGGYAHTRTEWFVLSDGEAAHFCGAHDSELIAASVELGGDARERHLLHAVEGAASVLAQFIHTTRRTPVPLAGPLAVRYDFLQGSD
jgi:hypothetical protein